MYEQQRRSRTMSNESDSGSWNETGSNLYHRNMLGLASRITLCSIAVVGLIGNGLVCFVVLKDRRMRNPTFIVLCSLALADVLCVTMVLPFSVYAFPIAFFPFDEEWFCRLLKCVRSTTTYASAYHLVTLSIVRYVTIVHPIRVRIWLTHQRTVGIVMTVWIMCTLVNIPVYFLYRTSPIMYNGQLRIFCYEDPTLGKEKVAYFITFVILAFLVPVSFIACFHICKLSKLRAARVSMNFRPPESEGRMPVMVALVIVIFTCSWLPFCMLRFMRSVNPTIFRDVNPKIIEVVQMVANCMSYINSCLNPIVYCFFSQNFRQCLLRNLVPWVQFEHDGAPVRSTARSVTRNAITVSELL